MLRIVLLLTVGLLASSATADITINKSIRVADGTKSGSLSSVNGSIDIGSDVEMLGGARSVNGGIRVGDDTQTEDLTSVNGRVRVGDRVTVDGDLYSVNGDIETGEGSQINGNVETVNGEIDLTGTTVYRDLETVHGGVTLDRESHIKGDLIIKKVHGNHNDNNKPLEIDIRNGSVVEGNIDVEDDDRKVVVRLSSGGKVMGEIRGAEVISN